MQHSHAVWIWFMPVGMGFENFRFIQPHQLCEGFGAFLWSSLVTKRVLDQDHGKDFHGHSSWKRVLHPLNRSQRLKVWTHINLLHTISCKTQQAFISANNQNKSFDCISSIQNGPACSSTSQTFQQRVAFSYGFVFGFMATHIAKWKQWFLVCGTQDTMPM